jgi:hypothetical protein
MLAAERQRNGTAAPATQTLPDLSPEMLMSAGAQAEYRAARQMAPSTTASSEVDLGDEPTIAADTMSQADLTALWMQNSDIPVDSTSLADVEPLDFEFSSDLDDEIPRAPMSRDRFRIDRPVPQRSFDRNLVNDQGPMEEEGRVRGGRFAVLRPRAPTRPIERVAPVEAPQREVTASRQSAVQQANALQSRTKAPTVYDRLRKNPYED